MEKKHLKFAKDAGVNFYFEVKVAVHSYFNENNVTPYANTQMKIKTCIILLTFLASYILIVFTKLPAFYKLMFCIVHGISIAAIGFNIAHDAGHQAYFKSKRHNKLLFAIMDFIGSNSYMWDVKHNKAHHIYTNVHSFDEDITGAYLLRLSPHSPLNPINQFQFIYAWVLYLFIYIHIVWVYNFQQFFATTFGPFKNLKHPPKEWFKLLLWKQFYFSYTIVLPLIFLDITWNQFLLGYFIVCASAGFLLAIVFYLGHCVELANEFPLPHKEQLNVSWAAQQMKTTCNFGTNNKVLTWLTGGLNFQIEHHLFPNICSIHYPQISKLVKTAAESHRLTYHNYPTFLSAVRSHSKMLKKLGQPQPPFEANAS
jgi:linoleoyl-CoA desaturase